MFAATTATVYYHSQYYLPILCSHHSLGQVPEDFPRKTFGIGEAGFLQTYAKSTAKTLLAFVKSSLSYAVFPKAIQWNSKPNPK